MSIEAMKQALEALELHGKQYPHMVKGYCLDAITALRTAIEQAEKQEPVAWSRASFIEDNDGRQIGTDEPEIAWGKEPPDEFGWSPLYTTPPAAPVIDKSAAIRIATALGWEPPAAQRQWVGLTDEEIFSVLGNLQREYNGPPTEDSRVVFALAIEAKLKEKNT